MRTISHEVFFLVNCFDNLMHEIEISKSGNENVLKSVNVSYHKERVAGKYSNLRRCIYIVNA